MSINLLAMIVLMIIDPGINMSAVEIDAQKIKQEKNAQKQNNAFNYEKNKINNSRKKNFISNKKNEQMLFKNSRKLKAR